MAEPTRTSDTERIEHQSQRAARVVQTYVNSRPNQLFTKKVSSGVITIPEAYQLLKDFARDPKTGVQRSDLLQAVLEYEMGESGRTGTPCSLGILDIDDFKQVNSQVGHLAADQLLRSIAEIVSHELRVSDEVLPNPDVDPLIRWGGEEFVLLLIGADLRAAHQAAERVRQSVQRAQGADRPDGKPVTASIGLAQYNPAQDSDWHRWLQRADQQLMAAKAAGKNQVYPRL